MLFDSKRRITLRTLGDAVLAKVAEPVLAVDAEIVKLAREMMEATVVFNGIGLAAPQYGVSKRMVVLDVPAESMSEVPTPGEEQLLPRMPLVPMSKPRLFPSMAAMFASMKKSRYSCGKQTIPASQCITVST
jgi:hypothetical protein